MSIRGNTFRNLPWNQFWVWKSGLGKVVKCINLQKFLHHDKPHTSPGSGSEGANVVIGNRAKLLGFNKIVLLWHRELNDICFNKVYHCSCTILHILCVKLRPHDEWYVFVVHHVWMCLKNSLNLTHTVCFDVSIYHQIGEPDVTNERMTHLLILHR